MPTDAAGAERDAHGLLAAALLARGRGDADVGARGQAHADVADRGREHRADQEEDRPADLLAEGVRGQKNSRTNTMTTKTPSVRNCRFR